MLRKVYSKFGMMMVYFNSNLMSFSSLGFGLVFELMRIWV